MLERVAADPRRQLGWGPSIMASPEEKRAYQAFQMMPQVEAGRLPVSALPEEYGGRPTGESRRSIRMAAAYDEAQNRALEQERIRQQMEREAKQMQIQEEQLKLQQRDQVIQEETFRSELNKKEAAQEIAGQTQAQSNNIFNWLNGKLVDENGKPIPKPDIKSRDFQSRLFEVAAQNPLGAEENRQLLDQYIAINKTYIGADDELKGAERQNIARIAELTGKGMSDFIKNDPATSREIVDYQALGKAEAEIQRKAPKEEEPVIGGKKQSEIQGIITSIEADMAAAEGAGNVAETEGLKKKKEYYQGLLSGADKGVDTTAKSQYSVPKDRVAGEVYDTPKGKLKWTGTGWTKP